VDGAGAQWLAVAAAKPWSGSASKVIQTTKALRMVFTRRF
jgi:hypothetical protein